MLLLWGAIIHWAKEMSHALMARFSRFDKIAHQRSTAEVIMYLLNKVKNVQLIFGGRKENRGRERKQAGEKCTQCYVIFHSSSVQLFSKTKPQGIFFLAFGIFETSGPTKKRKIRPWAKETEASGKIGTGFTVSRHQK